LTDLEKAVNKSNEENGIVSVEEFELRSSRRYNQQSHFLRSLFPFFAFSVANLAGKPVVDKQFVATFWKEITGANSSAILVLPQ